MLLDHPLPGGPAQPVAPLRVLQERDHSLGDRPGVRLDTDPRRLVHQLPRQADIRRDRHRAARHRFQQTLGRIVVLPLQRHEHARLAEHGRQVRAESQLDEPAEAQAVQGPLDLRAERTVPQQKEPRGWVRSVDSRHGFEEEHRVLVLDKAPNEDHPRLLGLRGLILLHVDRASGRDGDLLPGDVSLEEVHTNSLGQSVHARAPHERESVERQRPGDPDQAGQAPVRHRDDNAMVGAQQHQRQRDVGAAQDQVEETPRGQSVAHQEHQAEEDVVQLA